MTKRSPNPAKVARVEALKKHLAEAKSVGVVDYTGLLVNQATDLRRLIRAGGGEMKIEKNSLFRLALGRPSNNELTNQLTGLSAFVFSKSDEIAALKAVVGKLPFKFGLVGDRVLTAAEIEVLAKTPTRETSVVKLLFLLQYNTARFVQTLDAIRNTKH